jgi:hypothetical protein
MKSLLLAFLVVTFIGLSCQRRTCPPRKPDLVCPIQFNFKDFVCTDSVRIYVNYRTDYCKAWFNDSNFRSVVDFVQKKTGINFEPRWIFFVSKQFISDSKVFEENNILALGLFHYIPEKRELVLRVFLRDTLSDKYREVNELGGNVAGFYTFYSELLADELYKDFPETTIMNILSYSKNINSPPLKVAMKLRNDTYEQRFKDFMKKYKKQN